MLEVSKESAVVVVITGMSSMSVLLLNSNKNQDLFWHSQGASVGITALALVDLW